nr:EOG090X0ADH [Eulimnadia texana]
MRVTDILRNIGKFSKDYSNLPESYIKRAMEQVYWKAPRNLPQYLPKDLQRHKFRFTMSRPWTEEFRRQNAPNLHRKKVFVEPIKEWSFFRGDRVEILVGKDKGKQGTVQYIVQERNWVVVEGLNVTYKRIGKTRDFPGILSQSEAPLLVTSQVALVDPTDNKPTTVEWRFTESGDKVRVSSRTGRIIPTPIMAQETIDYKTKAGYPEQEKDSKADDVTAVTFDAKPATFEMDLSEKYGLVHVRHPRLSSL